MHRPPSPLGRAKSLAIPLAVAVLVSFGLTTLFTRGQRDTLESVQAQLEAQTQRLERLAHANRALLQQVLGGNRILLLVLRGIGEETGSFSTQLIERFLRERLKGGGQLGPPPGGGGGGG